MKKFILGFLSCFLLCSVTYVIAASIGSDEVLYDNSNSNSSATDVQGAIDEVYNTLDKIGSGYSLIAHAPEGLSTELVAGLYRYQGIQDASHNVNNYICFGTVNKSTCVGDTDKYMYRIIGINTNGQMKLIKKEALNSKYKWGSLTGDDWAHSDLFFGLNASYFLENTDYVPNNTWSNRIADTIWQFGSINDPNMTALGIYNTESGFNSTITAKIGLIYLHDYAYGLVGGNNCSVSGTGNICKTSWIFLLNNDANPPYDQYEWTITRKDSSLVWGARITGAFEAGYASNGYYGSSEFSVRPVFFLNSNERIASGSGTITDPYILS